jgi:hypothetical protein
MDLSYFDTDPDPRIRTTDLRNRILLFSSVVAKMPSKRRCYFSKFFADYFLKVHLHQSSKIKSKKEVTKYK